MLKKKKDKAIIKNIASTGVLIYAIQFIDTSNLIVLLGADEDIDRNNDQIVKLNIDTGKKTLLYTATCLEQFNSALSYSKNFLAFFDGIRKNSIYGQIKILNLKTNQISAIIPNSQNKLVSMPQWSPNESEIGYVEGSSIKVYNLKDKKIKTILTTSKDRMFYLYGFTNNNTLLFAETEEYSESMTKKLQTVDINTNEVKTICNVRKNGSLYIVDNGKKALVEVGY